MTFTDDQISGLTLDHLGLVASTIDKLGIMDKIDAKIPVSKQHGSKVSMGKRMDYEDSFTKQGTFHFTS